MCYFLQDNVVHGILNNGYSQKLHMVWFVLRCVDNMVDMDGWILSTMATRHDVWICVVHNINEMVFKTLETLKLTLGVVLLCSTVIHQYNNKQTKEQLEIEQMGFVPFRTPGLVLIGWEEA